MEGREQSPLAACRAPAPGLTHSRPSTMCAPHSGLYQLPIGPCLSLSASSPPELHTPGCQLSTGLTRGRWWLLGFCPGPSSRSLCHCHAATDPWQTGLRNRVKRHRDPRLSQISSHWVGARLEGQGLLWAGPGGAHWLHWWPPGRGVPSGF